MGASPFLYVIDGETNPEIALVKLKIRLGPEEPAVKKQSDKSPRKPFDFRNPDFDFEDTDDLEGISLFDLFTIGEEPGLAIVTPLSDEELMRCFQTVRPSREQVQASQAFFENIGRGEARYIILHTNGEPNAVLFAGYSVD